MVVGEAISSSLFPCLMPCCAASLAVQDSTDNGGAVSVGIYNFGVLEDVAYFDNLRIAGSASGGVRSAERTGGRRRPQCPVHACLSVTEHQ